MEERGKSVIAARTGWIWAYKKPCVRKQTWDIQTQGHISGVCWMKYMRWDGLWPQTLSSLSFFLCIFSSVLSSRANSPAKPHGLGNDSGGPAWWCLWLHGPWAHPQASKDSRPYRRGCCCPPLHLLQLQIQISPKIMWILTFPPQEPHASLTLLPGAYEQEISRVLVGKWNIFSMETIDFLISPPTKLRHQYVVCWCVYFCFSAGNLEVCLAWHTLFPAENLISCQSKVGEMWKNPITSCKLYVTALPGTKKKKKKILCCLPTAWGELSLLAMQYRSVKHVVISV